MIVLDANKPQEELKVELADADSRFYLIRSKDPFAIYKVVWFRLPNGRSCKVDILQPGILNIPAIEPTRIEHVDGIPLLPFVVVLMLKLQGWTDHRGASKTYLCEKQWMDVTDIKELLPIAVRRGVKPREEAWIPESLIQATERRVREYVERFPYTRDLWRELGFEEENASLDVSGEVAKILETDPLSITDRTEQLQL